jgi:hypothetical protein
MWPYFTVPLEGHNRQVWLYIYFVYTVHSSVSTLIHVYNRHSKNIFLWNQILPWLLHFSGVSRTIWEGYVRPESISVDTLECTVYTKYIYSQTWLVHKKIVYLNIVGDINSQISFSDHLYSAITFMWP